MKIDNCYIKTFKLLFFLFLIVIFYSCEKDIETYRLTNKERDLVMLYERGDTIRLKDKGDKIYKYHIDEIDSGIAENNFLGIPKYKYEWVDINFDCTNYNCNGTAGCNKSPKGWIFNIEINFPENSFNFYYEDNVEYKHRMRQKDLIELDSTTYHDVYIFNNAPSDTSQITQKIYLNTKHGFLKLEDLEKDISYTIVRD